MRVPNKTKSINVKGHNMITRINKSKTLIKHLIVLYLIGLHVIQMKNGIMKHVNVSVKIILSANRIIIGILAHVVDDKKVRYKMNYVFHAVLLAIILLFIIAIICYHYTKQRAQQKNIGAQTI